MIGRQPTTNRRRLRGEIAFYFVKRIKRNNRTIEVWAQKTLDNYGPARPRKECTAMARAAGKRAVFIIEQRDDNDQPMSPVPPRKLEPLERCEMYLSDKQLKMVRQVWATIQDRRYRLGVFGVVVYLDAEKLFIEEAGLAARELFRASSFPGGTFDPERKLAASKRLRAIGAALEWLRLAAGDHPDAPIEREEDR